MGKFIDALDEDRCEAPIILRDRSEARCGRAKAGEHLCTQHARIAARFACDYCGGSDEPIPDHCMDCGRPQEIAA